METKEFHYRAYRPRPFAKEERSKTTILFGGLTWKHERLIQGSLERMGYKSMPLPNIERQDLDIGKEFIDVGACCPTTFTAGNLARTLITLREKEGEERVKNDYLFVTIGACGPCRFGQYHESYERVLEGMNLRDFRLFLLDLLQMEQSAPGGGLEISMPLTFGLVYSMFYGDLITDMEYAIRPYEVVEGSTDRVVKESIELLYERLKNRPIKGKKIDSLAWHVFTGYFGDALKEVRRLWDEIEVDRLRVKPKVKITGEFWLQTHEGDGNYNIKRWLEKEGAEVIPPPVAVWMDYLINMELFKLEDAKGFVKKYYLKKLAIGTIAGLYKMVYNRLRKALNNIPNPLPDQRKLKELARPYFHYRLTGGEGHMLIGKALYAYLNRQAHMICELSPYGCLPNTMSVGAMAKVLGDYPDLLYAPIEIKGDAEVHAYSRCQMILTEAKRRAREEFEEVLERTGLTVEDIRNFEEEHPELKKATYKVPHYGYAGTASNYVMHVAKLMGEDIVMLLLGIDVGSTTCKYVLTDEKGNILDRAYERHNTKQSEKVLEFLLRLEGGHGLKPSRDRVYITGSGGGLIGELIGARFVQEVVAVATAVEKLHPDVRFVSEIGGEDMKTIFIKEQEGKRNRQVYMQNVCAGGTGTFIEKSARKLGISSDVLSQMDYEGYTLHRISSKCGIFAEADVNSLVKAGVPKEEIIASLFEAVVYQNLAQLTKGNTPLPKVLLLGGPNLFFKGLQQAWRLHLQRLWKERGIGDFSKEEMEKLVIVPENSLYYAALGCIFTALEEEGGLYAGTERLRWWVEEGQYEQKLKEGKGGLVSLEEELLEFKKKYSYVVENKIQPKKAKEIIIGCDFGSTTAKAVCITPDKEIVFSCYSLSKGNPIEDAKDIFRQIKEYLGDGKVLALGLTGYGKDLLKDVLGADVAVVETVAHAVAGLHFFPDADCICDVGGVDVKIMILRQGSVVDFRLNSQCSSGNGAFLQGVAERFSIPLSEIADRAFSAKAMPSFTMGCGVFLQSDIVNQQRKGWKAEEILAGLCYVLPLNVWVYAGNINNLSQVGKKFILQGGTHRNLAVVKAQIDFIKSKVPDAEVYVHPYSGEAGAIGSALIALEHYQKHGKTSFRGFESIERLTYRSTTSKDTVCHWCPVNCQRSFIDVYIGEGEGRPWSKVPLTAGWVRLIVNNACPKGLVEDERELKAVKERMERLKHEFPNIADFVKKEAFKVPRGQKVH